MISLLTTGLLAMVGGADMGMKVELDNFTTEEFRCPCGRECDPKVTPISRKLLIKLWALKDITKQELIITSGFRCKHKNKDVGGAIHSQHLFGRAVDIKTVGWTDTERLEFIIQAMKIGFTGIGKNIWHIHLDVRDGPFRYWEKP